MKTTRGAGLRKILVVSQYVVSTAFIIRIIVANQMSYIRTEDLGFEKDRTMVIWFQSLKVHNDVGADLRFRHREVKVRFEQHSSIMMPTLNRFHQGAYVTNGVFQPEGSTEKMRIGYTDMDEDFVDFFGLEDLAEQEENGQALLSNESAMRHFGWRDPGSSSAKDPIGKQLHYSRGNRGQGTKIIIVGVLKDYHTHSLWDRFARSPSAFAPTALGISISSSEIATWTTRSLSSRKPGMRYCPNGRSSSFLWRTS